MADNRAPLRLLRPKQTACHRHTALNKRTRAGAAPRPSPSLFPSSHSSLALVSMPKEAKEPLFCCGAHHNSANYHRRTVHQKYTKIVFKHHRNENFVLRRNPATSLFHCPHCDKSWAMATPIRVSRRLSSRVHPLTSCVHLLSQNHIFTKCEGYAQFRTPAASKDKTQAEEPAPAPDEENVDLTYPPSENTSQTTEQSKLKQNEQTVTPVIDVVGRIRTPPSTASPTNQEMEAVPDGVQEVTASANPVSHGTSLDGALALPPTLRPAIWSPPTMSSASRGLAPLSASSYSSSVPSLTRSGSSCSSGSFALTLPDISSMSGASALPKPEPEDCASVSNIISRYASSQPSVDLSPVPPLPSSHSPTAVRTFLDSLRRPLGHASPLLYKMGLVTDEDLELICTMPEAWDEVGTMLTAGGVTVIEWLMVKEAFKAKAKGLSH
ncbi:hypothetical protein BD413DRAFT_119289 [Trametes elegans]|nr:hypothetical protein BD413DRAFT_119289 [Trametes elegans]